MNALVHVPAMLAERVMTLLPGEIALAHTLMMRTAGLANGLLDRAAAAPDDGSEMKGSLAAASLAGLSARLMQRFVDGAQALRVLRAQGVRPAADARAGEAIVNPPPPARPAAAKYHAAPGLARGRLRNGNPSGDFLAAPRCAARTRAGGCCRQPGMANGRCRFHGGKSTGARTPAGLARCRAARLAHGGRAGAVI
ncbi:MAG: HGGxSTG domain-containing protein, partial [Dongiaceae bacterium]